MLVIYTFLRYKYIDGFIFILSNQKDIYNERTLHNALALPPQRQTKSSQ